MNDVLDLIRAIDPCAGRDPDPERLDAALERIVAEVPRGGVSPRRRVRRAGFALALAACLAGVALVLSPGEHVAPASAAAVLRDARSAVLQLDGPGPWTVVATRDWRNEPPGPPVPYLTETWSSDDGQQLTRVTREGESAGPADPYDGKLIRRDTAGFGPTVAEIRALPTEPAALTARLGKDVVQGATMLLLSPAPTAELRAALYDVLLRTPGATLIPSLTAPDGRTGVGVRFATPTPPHEQTLLFDARTHALLGVGQGGTWDLVLRVERVGSAPPPDLEEHMSDGRPEYVPVR